MTVSGEGLPALAVLQDIAVQAGVSVAISDDVGKQPVTVEFAELPAQEAFEEVGRLLKRPPMFRAGLVSYPERREVPDAIAAVRSGFVSPERAAELMRAVVKQGGDVALLDDRVVVAGSSEVVRLAELLSRQFESGADGWSLEVRIVRVSRSVQRQLGIEWDVSGRVEVGLDAGIGNKTGLAPVLGARAVAAVNLLARWAEQSSEVEALSTGRLFLMEGGEASLQQGDTVPVPQRTVSPEGTVTVTGYERVRTGFLLKAKGRRVPDGVFLQLEPTLSAVTGYVDGAPIVSESSVSASVVVDDGGWVILSGLEAKERSDTTGGLPGGLAPWWASSSKRAAESSLLVLVRADRVYASGAKP